MTNTEYLIVGAGPAGLQLGHHLQQAGRDYAILEAGPAPGGFFRTFPRHRRLISINKPHTGWDDPELNLRMDWNSLLSDDPRLLFTRYTERYFADADDLVRYLADYAATLRTAAQNAWTYLQTQTTMFPANGNDGGGSGGSGGGLAAAGADANAGMDFRLRVLAAAELY